MFLFATIIYFGDQPAGYDVYREENSFHLKPAVDSRLNWNPPVIRANFSGEVWYINGTEESEITEQVKKIIEMNDLVSSLNVAS